MVNRKIIVQFCLLFLCRAFSKNTFKLHNSSFTVRIAFYSSIKTIFVFNFLLLLNSIFLCFLSCKSDFASLFFLILSNATTHFCVNEKYIINSFIFVLFLIAICLKYVFCLRKIMFEYSIVT